MYIWKGYKMKSAKQTNAIVQMVKTTQGATVKTVSTKPSFTDTEIIQLGCDIGKAYLGFDTASESLNKIALNAHEGGLRCVDLRKVKDESAKPTKLFKSAVIDTLVAGGKSARTAGDYYELIAKAVNSGKPIVTTNPRKKAKGGEKAEGDIANIIAKLNAHSGFSDLSEDFQECVRDFLSEQGYEGIH